jgi:cytochrome c-type biogenesis protein CcmH/NrfG
LSSGDSASAAVHLQRAVVLDPEYSAGWKLLGKARTALGEFASARQAYELGIAAAVRRGDKQAEKEMRVFLRRLPG